jgi:ubiquinone/menaquinone biosynthesis C-methylase UbiE
VKAVKGRNSTYNIKKASLGIESEVDRLKAQAVMGWEKEFRNLKWYGLENGTDVLELGSGPGFYTEQLVSSLPRSRVTALEYDSILQDKAIHMLSDIPESRLRFVQASIYETGLPDNAYDFAVARLLFLHLHHPIQAAKEIFRVLRPGGKLVIIDIDDGIFGVIHPVVESLHTILKKIADLQASKGGNRYLGRMLPRLLMEVGFVDVDMDATLQHSDIHGVEGFKKQFNIQRFKGLFEKGIIEEHEFKQLREASERIHNSNDAYAMMTFFMACGTKPHSF